MVKSFTRKGNVLDFEITDDHSMASLHDASQSVGSDRLSIEAYIHYFSNWVGGPSAHDWNHTIVLEK